MPALHPPHRAPLPVWLALLLKRQRRANIVPPPWLAPPSLAAIVDYETEHADGFSPGPRLPPAPSAGAASAVFSPPFVAGSTADAAPDALPYHWIELGEMLLEVAADDFEDADAVRRLLRSLREVRLEKMRKGVEKLEADGGWQLNGVGAMEMAEGRAFIGGVVDGLRFVHSIAGLSTGPANGDAEAVLRDLTLLCRKISASREQQQHDGEFEERENGFPGQASDDEDDEMEM